MQKVGVRDEDIEDRKIEEYDPKRGFLERAR